MTMYAKAIQTSATFLPVVRCFEAKKYLTNREALTVLCSVTQEAARARKKCFFPLLECSSRFLSAFL